MSSTDDENRKRVCAMLQNFLDVPEEATQYVDENVVHALPPGSKIVDFKPHGKANWTKTIAINTIQASSAPLRFFLKVNHGDGGRENLIGEFESLKTIHSIMPEFSPKLYTCGTYASNPNVHFLLMEFLDMTGNIPDVERFSAKMAEMHRKAISPNGKFGFHISTGLPFLQGESQQPNTWTSSWETFFSDIYVRIFQCEQNLHGADPEMQVLFKSMVEKVIPRLLRPLETGGNNIQPSLLHGDLWDGNTGADAVTGAPMIYDATSFYGHNEYDLGPWSISRHRIGRDYIDEYLRHFERSDPKEDFEDRMTLYRHCFDLRASSCFPDKMMCREQTIPDMRYLVKKYPNGYEGPHCRKREDGNEYRAVL